MTGVSVGGGRVGNEVAVGGIAVGVMVGRGGWVMSATGMAVGTRVGRSDWLFCWQLDRVMRVNRRRVRRRRFFVCFLVFVVGDLPAGCWRTWRGGGICWGEWGCFCFLVLVVGDLPAGCWRTRRGGDICWGEWGCFCFIVFVVGACQQDAGGPRV